MKPGQGNRIIRTLSTSFRVLRVLLRDLCVPEHLKMLEYPYVNSAFSAFGALTSRKTLPQSCRRDSCRQRSESATFTRPQAPCHSTKFRNSCVGKMSSSYGLSLDEMAVLFLPERKRKRNHRRKLLFSI